MARTAEEPLDYFGRRLKKLSDTELEFMRFIWAHPGGISSEAIYEQFPQARGTKSTILHKISQKGYVENKQCGRHHIYVANFTETEYNQAILRQQLQKNFGNSSLEHLVAAFCGKKSLTDKQLVKLKAFLKELEDDVGNE